MSFVQIIEFSTEKIDEVEKLSAEFRERRMKEGGPKPSRMILGRDRDRENTYLRIVQFDSYEDAMENSKRPDTTELSQRMAALCDGAPKFVNLDVIADETL
ncbi:MAG: hypothetical protein JOZ99_03410 [Actinobacteria bacterium]|nr:hypothetical protein [Actinomycetota bacterium]